MPITASSAQIAAQPTQVGGSPALSASEALSQSATTHTARALVNQLIALQIARFGTLTNDCSLELQLSMDGGLSFRTLKTYSNAQINTANGVYDVLTVKGTHWRFVLIPGTMTGANGVNCRVFD